MNQRSVAAVVAMPLAIALAVVAWVRPLPYVRYAPGPTLDVLGASDGKEIIQVSGHQTYRDDGELRMTTVSVSQRDNEMNLFEVMATWFNPNDAVYPRDAVYQDDRTEEEDRSEGAVQMVTSQDAAAAVALRELGYDVTSVLEVLAITPGAPADGALAVRDVIRAINGHELEADLRKASDLVLDEINGTPEGDPVDFTVLRDGDEVDVSVTPKKVQGKPRVGIQIGEGFDLPFTVGLSIDPNIGGPSAGLMFSLAIYDTLTPGSLTGGETVAGTGELRSDGAVGPIGGIQQKIVGARDAGAELFLVPADNCEDTEGAHNGDMRLVKARTMHSALEAIEAWVDDPDADLPTCGED
jgi:PDZ domain-containing protein